MPNISVSLSGGSRYHFAVRPFEVVKYYRDEGAERFPLRPKFPLTLWVTDIAIKRSRAAFEGQKPIRLTIEPTRGFLND